MRRMLPLEQTVPFAVLVGAVLLTLFAASPLVQRLPSWDSGVFLYTDWRVTQGELPYRDVWDHKPPLVFVVDALGVWLGGGSRWGVWALEVISLTLAVSLAFVLIRRAFGAWSAWYAVVAILVNAFLTMDGGNYTTEYALPIQFAMLWVIAASPRDILSARRAFLLGVLSAALFWLKQNNLGIPCALCAYLLLQLIFCVQKRAVLASFAALLGGFAVVSLLVVAPFAFAGALGEFWEAAFAFNFAYIQQSWFERLIVLRYVPIFIPALGLTLFAVMGWLVGALSFGSALHERGAVLDNWRARIGALRGVENRESDASWTTAQTSRLTAIGLLALPAEAFWVALSGKAFGHYFLAFLPVMAVLAGFWLGSVLGVLERAGLSARTRGWFVLGLLAVLLLFASENVRSIGERLATRELDTIVNFIRKDTDPRDEIFIWGSGARILFETQRHTPTRFAYLNRVTNPKYADLQTENELLDGLAQNPPRWILRQDSASPMFSFPIESDEIRAKVSAILAMYQAHSAPDHWTVYERR